MITNRSCSDHLLTCPLTIRNVPAASLPVVCTESLEYICRAAWNGSEGTGATTNLLSRLHISDIL